MKLFFWTMEFACSPPPRKRRYGFTLVELLVSMAILAVLLAIITTVIAETQKTWRQAVSRTTQFREARAAFDLMVRNLTQATLNTYWDYYRTNPDDPLEAPSRYVRKSELQFACGPASTLLSGSNLSGHAVFFQAPLGLSDDAAYEKLDNLLSARGYFIKHGSDASFRPAFLAGYTSPEVSYRFRLMEFAPPAEYNLVYAEPGSWFKNAGAADAPYVRPVGENIVALFISPRVPEKDVPAGQEPTYIAPAYRYDSTTAASGSSQGTQHLLPPLVEITMVALDQASAARLEEDAGNTMPALVTAAGASFADASKQREDLMKLEAFLADRKLNFRIFTTTVTLRTAKWSL